MSEKLSVVVFANQDTGCEVIRFLADQADASVSGVVSYPNSTGPYWHADVKRAAADCGLRVIAYRKDSIRDDLSQLGEIDLLLSVGWRNKIRADVLAMPKIGAVNFHNSLLPRHRGAFANTWPLLLGESRTGVSLHWMAENLDEGEVIAQRSFPIPSWHTAREVAERVHAEYLVLFQEMWPRVREWRQISKKQNSGGASYHSVVDFISSDEIDLERCVRIGDFLNFLRAKTYEPYYKNAFYYDAETGKKVYVSIILVHEDHWQGNGRPSNGSR